MMSQIAEFVAVLSCSLFAGAAIYISLVEHPARMKCGVEIAATEFAPSYGRATILQATCAAVGLLSSIAAWLAGASFWWIVAGVLLGSVIPFTLIAILPTNKRLLSPTLDSFGISKVLPDYVVETTVHRIGQSSTKMEISHYYSAPTLKAKLLNLIASRKIARDTQATLYGITAAIERGAAIKNG